jgi:Holliday junction DNA helicase RuvA
MYEYIQGHITGLSPAYAIVENNGIGYFLHITVNTYAKLEVNKSFKMFIHYVVREDAHLLFGFLDVTEREMFRLLISVNGIGPNTARMILSSMTSEEISHAISTENLPLLQSIKGIGSKTAQRMIVDLKDKVIKANVGEQIIASEYNTSRNEALSALVMLGFAKNQVEKILNQISKTDKELSVEELVKRALKVL